MPTKDGPESDLGRFPRPCGDFSEIDVCTSGISKLLQAFSLVGCSSTHIKKYDDSHPVNSQDP